MTKYLTFTVYIVSNQLIFEKEHLNLKCYWDENIVYPILILVNYNYESIVGFKQYIYLLKIIWLPIM